MHHIKFVLPLFFRSCRDFLCSKYPNSAQCFFRVSHSFAVNLFETCVCALNNLSSTTFSDTHTERRCVWKNQNPESKKRRIFVLSFDFFCYLCYAFYLSLEGGERGMFYFFLLRQKRMSVKYVQFLWTCFEYSAIRLFF